MLVERFRLALRQARLDDELARPELEALADDLVEVSHPTPRGVALAVQLLRDGAGPLYRSWSPTDLREAAEGARAAL